MTAELRAALVALARAVDALHASDDVVRELSRSGLGAALAAAQTGALHALTAEGWRAL